MFRVRLGGLLTAIMTVTAFAPAASGQATQLCYMVSDQGNPADVPDILATYEPSLGVETTLGPIKYSTDGANARLIEAIAIDPSNLDFYAADGGQLGLLADVADANGDILFTPVGAGFGTADGALGNQNLSDVDGITFDPTRGLMYGCHRRGGGANDLLFRINKATGQFVSGAMVGGADYVEIQAVGDDDDCDDLGVDPETGTMYVIMNDGGQDDQVAVLDPLTGNTVSLPNILGIADLEGITFDTAGNIVGSTGTNTTTGTQNSYVTIDKSSGIALTTTGLNLVDYESLRCIIPNCGNGVIDGDEECDDSNIIPGDNCSPVCRVEVCGNGVVDLGEQCDDDNTTAGDGCGPRCRTEDGFACSGDPSVCNETCGNSVVDPGEQCDDGNDVNADGCANNCVISVGGFCQDGVVDAGEQCDDGNNTNGDGCDTLCDIEPGYACALSPSQCEEVCGDGVVTPSEGCDDGDTDGGDGCNGVCLIENNFTCNQSAPGLLDGASCASGVCNPSDNECGNEPPVGVNDADSTLENVPVVLSIADLLSNDNDPDGDTLSLNTFTQPANGTVADNGNGTLTYTPNNNFDGVDTFTYEVCDPLGLCDTVTVTITVTGVNVAPVAVNDDIGDTPENTAVTFTNAFILSNDSDPDGDVLVAQNFGNPANGTLVDNGNGTLTYTPNDGFEGDDSFTYEACDPDGLCDEATVVVTVLPGNEPPVAVNNDLGNHPEDAPVTFSAADILGNDNDPDGDVLSVGNFTQPANGVLVDNGNGTFTYTPNDDFNGDDSFTYQACDPSGLCDTATVVITIDPVNDRPVATNDNVGTTPEGTPFTYTAATILGNDNDPDGDTLSINRFDQPANGTVVDNGNGTFTYTPNDGFDGTDTYEYEVCDPGGLCDTAIVTIVVTNVGQAPVAVNDQDTTPQSTPVTVDLLDNDSDPDGDPLTIQNLQDPPNGTVVDNGNGTITYTPDDGFSGTETFTYQACDPGPLCDTATVTIIVVPDCGNGVIDASEGCDDGNVAAGDGCNQNCLVENGFPCGDTGLVGPAACAANECSENDNTGLCGPITCGDGVTDAGEGCDDGNLIDGDGCNATCQCTDFALSTGYDETTGRKLAAGSADSWTWSNTIDGTFVPAIVTDKCAGVWETPFEGTSWVTRSPDCDAFAAGEVVFFKREFEVTDPANFSLQWDTYADNYIAGVFINGQEVALSGNTDSNGVLISLFNRAVTVSVNDGFVAGTNEIVIRHEQEGQRGAPGGLLLDVSPYSVCTNGNNNGAPVAVADTAETPEDAPVTINVQGNDSDPDGDVLTVTEVRNPANGTVMNNGNGTVLYTPNENFNGTDTFTYVICDTSNVCATQTVTVTVTPVDDEPVARDDGVVTDVATPVTVDASANDVDFDGGDLTVTQVTVAPANGTAQIVGNDIVYTPEAGFSGSDTLTYSVCNESNLCDTAVVTIIVGGDNTAPAPVDDADVTDEDTPVELAVLANDVDPDGDVVSLGDVNAPNDGTAVGNANGTLTYTPDANFAGTDTFTYEACDPFGACTLATVVVVVTPVNDAPIAAADSATTPVDVPVTLDVVANDQDPDGDDLTVSPVLTAEPIGGTVVVENNRVVYTPNIGFTGSDSFEYEVCDPAGLCDTAVVTVSVGDGNTSPSIVDDEVTTPEETDVIIFVLVNDQDAQDAVLTNPEVTRAPQNGEVVVNTDGTVTYSPDVNFNGVDTFEYQSCDATGLCGIATVTIIVTPVNDAPSAADDQRQTPVNAPIDIDVVANDSDVDGDPLTYNGVVDGEEPSDGVVTTNDDGTVNYAPNADFTGTDSFGYEVCDTAGVCDTATVTILVEDGNSNPVAVDDVAETEEENSVNIAVLDNDTDDDDDDLTLGAFTQPENGSVSLGEDGTLDYLPNVDFVGEDTFTYEACDAASCDTATVTVTVTPANDAPIALDDEVVTGFETPIVIDVQANDVDPDGDDLTTAEITVAPVNGIAVIEDDGTITYTPAAGFEGVETFEYSVCDPLDLCDTAIVVVTIDNNGTPPIAIDDVATTNIDTPVDIAILDNDSDPNGDELELSNVVQPANGTVAVNADQSVNYTPDAGFEGTDVFTYEICNAVGLCDEATVTVTIGTPPNEGPRAIDDAVFTEGPTPITVDVVANDVDPNGDALTPQNLVAPANGSAVVDPVDGTITYTPDAGFEGPDFVEYEVCDPAGLCDAATLLILVGGPNDNDGDGLSNNDELALGTDPNDDDSDDDGIADGLEPSPTEDSDGDGVPNALDPDSDNDGLADGTETGVEAPLPGTDRDAGAFTPDADDGATVTNPLDPDSDNGGVSDGSEDTNKNGVVEPGEGEPVSTPGDDVIVDTDGDGLSDAEESLFGSDPNDRDTDDDGIIDSEEPNWTLDTDRDGDINVLDPDSDNDLVLDGTEVGIVEADLDADTDVDAGNFTADADPSTTTSPINPDTDGGTVNDGVEDANQDGRVDEDETDPNDRADDLVGDRDADGVLDGDDNCPDDPNPNQEDADDDGIGDVCDDVEGGDDVGIAGGGIFRGCLNTIVSDTSVSSFGLFAMGILGFMLRRRKRS